MSSTDAFWVSRADLEALREQHEALRERVAELEDALGWALGAVDVGLRYTPEYCEAIAAHRREAHG